MKKAEAPSGRGESCIRPPLSDPDEMGDHKDRPYRNPEYSGQLPGNMLILNYIYFDTQSAKSKVSLQKRKNI